MGNGAIGAFTDGVDDPDFNPEQEALHIKVIQDYYDVVYNQQNFNAIDDYIDPDMRVHRDGKVATGRAALKSMIIATVGSFGDLRVHVQEIIAGGSWVSYRINVEFNRGLETQRRRVRGIVRSEMRNGLVAESWVKYEAEELIETAASAPAAAN